REPPPFPIRVCGQSPQRGTLRRRSHAHPQHSSQCGNCNSPGEVQEIEPVERSVKGEDADEKHDDGVKTAGYGTEIPPFATALAAGDPSADEKCQTVDRVTEVVKVLLLDIGVIENKCCNQRADDDE